MTIPTVFSTLLRECNRQRVKSLDEMLAKRLSRPIRRKPHRSLIDYREQRAADAVADSDVIQIPWAKERAAISAGKATVLGRNQGGDSGPETLLAAD